MQRSPSLTQAISTAEALLRADTDDLRQLAAIAGQDPTVMYLGADLTGVDLTSQDISFLVGIGTKFEGAKLTKEQRQQLRRGSAQETQYERRKTIRDLRVEMVLRFIERHINDDMMQYSSELGITASELGITASDNFGINTSVEMDRNQEVSLKISFESTIREVLLDPILQSISSNPNNNFGSDYMSAALIRLSRYLTDNSRPFFEELFRLFGDLHCPVDSEVIPTLKHKYQAQLGNDLGNIIARMRSTHRIDFWWVFEKNEVSDMISAAIQLSQHRHIHVSVIEKFAIDTSELELLIYILAKAHYILDNDQAERIAYMIISKNWPAFMVKHVLDARVPRQLAVAIFRQLLAQGNSSRVSEVVRWLDKSKGAVGALSLENAINNIDNFEAVYRLADILGPNLKGNQIDVFIVRLSELAKINSEYLKIRSFKLRYLSNFYNISDNKK